MNISSYADLLSAAKRQAEPQRLLFVFASAELPGTHDASQKERFDARQGGALLPVMCVDKLPGELGDFASLVEESRHTGTPWDVVFAASLGGRAGVIPSAADAEQPLKRMIAAIQAGSVQGFLAFDRQGELLRLSGTTAP